MEITEEQDRNALKRLREAMAKKDVRCFRKINLKIRNRTKASPKIEIKSPSVSKIGSPAPNEAMNTDARDRRKYIVGRRFSPKVNFVKKTNKLKSLKGFFRIKTPPIKFKDVCNQKE